MFSKDENYIIVVYNTVPAKQLAVVSAAGFAFGRGSMIPFHTRTKKNDDGALRKIYLSAYANVLQPHWNLAEK